MCIYVYIYICIQVSGDKPLTLPLRRGSPPPLGAGSGPVCAWVCGEFSSGNALGVLGGRERIGVIIWSLVLGVWFVGDWWGDVIVGKGVFFSPALRGP